MISESEILGILLGGLWGIQNKINMLRHWRFEMKRIYIKFAKTHTKIKTASMKKVVLIVLTILLLNGCDSSHKYYFVTIDINKGGNLRDGEPWEMKEDNDSLAIEIAKFIHTSRQLTFEKTHTNNKESKIEGAPYSFKLLDHRMNTLYDATHDVIIPNENKVIADIEFGMSQKQVYKLLSKSDRFRDIHRYSDMISFYQEIGNRSYNGTLDFLDDRLYRLSFT